MKTNIKLYVLYDDFYIITEKEVKSILRWCKKNLGKSKYNNIKALKIQRNNRIKNFGVFDYKTNTIIINMAFHTQEGGLIDLIDTIIHEYAHFKQDIKNEYKPYFKHSSDSLNHPLEKVAYRTAKKYAKICKKELF